jgi:SAM-dependent methyltransferase
MQEATLGYVCPQCRAPLKIRDAACAGCAYPIQLTPHGSVLVPTDVFHDHDHPTIVAAAAGANLNHYEQDERINRQFILNYSVPQIESLFGQRRDLRILSVGCGIGIDVDLLRGLGYDAWGTDCGSRCLFWFQRESAPYLAQCTDEHLPFADGSFDLVMCHQVLEHVGVVGDTMELQPNSKAIRQRFLDNLVRVTKPGGYINVATPNRTFPLDPGHAPNFFGIRVHGPFDHFLTSYGDMRTYFKGHQVRPTTPANYYAGSLAARAGRVGRWFRNYIAFLDRNERLQGTFMNPLTSVLVRKQGQGVSRADRS